MVYNEKLDRTSGKGVTMEGKRIKTITALSGKTYLGKMFIDATYVGDLMAAANVTYTFGREGGRRSFSEKGAEQSTAQGEQTSCGRQAEFFRCIEGEKEIEAMKQSPTILTTVCVTALLLAPLVALRAAELSATPEKSPAFSWERVPRYMHIRKDTAFTAEEIRYLASFPLLTFEKSTGTKEYGSTEEGTLAAARAVKKISPATTVLYYRNVFVHYGGYAANAALTNITGAFLVGRNGSDKLVRNQVPAYDLTNAKVRDWWLASAKQVCAEPSIDGLFVDGNIKVLEPGYLRNEIGETKKAGVVDGYTAMMEEARRLLGPEKLMVANVLRARFPDSGMSRLQAFSGSYLEGFETAVGNVPVKDYVAKGIAAFQEAARRGFIIAFTAGLGEEDSDDGAENQRRTDEIRKAMTGGQASTSRFQYLLAIFLICAEKQSYFCAHDGYDAKRSKVWMTQPPEFDRPLGAPKGPAIRTAYVYTREFAHASVRLDLDTQTAKIDWR